MKADESVHTLTGHCTPKSAGKDLKPSAAAVALVAPTISASPDEREMLCRVELHAFTKGFPIIRHPPLVDFLVLIQPAQSVSL